MILREERAVPWVLAGLSALTLAVFLPALGYDFIAFDDNDYVYENAMVFGGLTLDNVRAAFTEPVSAHWHPLTMLSLMLDTSLFGTGARGYHATNVLLHLVNVLLLFVALRAMTKRVWPSAFVAAVFAVHPLHVEPVVWIASRKDVLSATFWILAMLAYVRYAQQPKVSRFALAGLLMTLGLMAKSILAVLPCALLLLDFWPLRRISFATFREDRRKFFGVIAEKAALLSVGIGALAVNAIAQNYAGQVGTMGRYTLWDRIANTSVAYGTYLYQTVWPVGLTLYYPLPSEGHGILRIVVSIAVLAILTFTSIAMARKHPAAIVGWFWFLGVLAPVAGFVQLGAQAHADRYMYLPLIGLAIAVVWPVSDWVAARKRVMPATVAACACTVLMATMAGATLANWRNSETAFAHCLEVTRENYLIHYNYANVLHASGRTGEAVEHFERALAVSPNHAASHINYGALLANLGEYDRAVQHFNAALASEPSNASALCNLAIALMDSGRPSEALAPMRRALDVAPDEQHTQQTARLVFAAQPEPIPYSKVE